jgi:hypothetical protein
MANTGEEFALEVENKHLREAIKELGRNLGEISGKQAFAENIVRGLKNPDMMVNGASLTLDMVQIMENGDIRVIPPPPAPGPDTCSPDKNGKKPEKELVNAS